MTTNPIRQQAPVGFFFVARQVMPKEPLGIHEMHDKGTVPLSRFVSPPRLSRLPSNALQENSDFSLFSNRVDFCTKASWSHMALRLVIFQQLPSLIIVGISTSGGISISQAWHQEPCGIAWL